MTETFYDQHERDDSAWHDDIPPPQTGSQRVIRLLLIALLTLLIIGIIVFGLIPYIESLNQPTAPPMPPPIQT